MTPDEKADLNHRLATLADAAGIPEHLLWDVAEMCPQGHTGPEFAYFGLIPTTGEICPLCREEYWLRPRLAACRTQKEIVDLARSLWDFMTQCNEDPRLYPEWRIGRQPRDFTDPEHLLPVVKTWIRRRPADEDWTFQVSWYGTGATANVYAEVSKPTHGEDPDSEWVALARAFLEVMKGEHADEKD